MHSIFSPRELLFIGFGSSTSPYNSPIQLFHNPIHVDHVVPELLEFNPIILIRIRLAHLKGIKDVLFRFEIPRVRYRPEGERSKGNGGG